MTTRTELNNLISESTKYGDEAQYIAKLIEKSIIFQSEKFKQIEQKIIHLNNQQNEQYKLLHTIACNFNPIFAFEQNSEDN